MPQPESSDRDLWVEWDEYNELIERLAVAVHQSGWAFDTIICLARGGMRVGDVISRVFEKPLGSLATSSYRQAAGTLQGDLDIAAHITLTRGKIAGRILLVDDLVDSGHTFGGVRDHLLAQFPEIVELRTAVLWFKAHSVVIPDFFVQRLETNPWIHQPFEQYDEMRPGELAERLARKSQ